MSESVNSVWEKELNDMILRWLDQVKGEYRPGDDSYIDSLAAILTTLSKGTAAIALSGKLPEQDFVSAMRTVYRVLQNGGRGSAPTH